MENRTALIALGVADYGRCSRGSVRRDQPPRIFLNAGRCRKLRKAEDSVRIGAGEGT